MNMEESTLTNRSNTSAFRLNDHLNYKKETRGLAFVFHVLQFIIISKPDENKISPVCYRMPTAAIFPADYLRRNVTANSIGLHKQVPVQCVRRSLFQHSNTKASWRTTKNGKLWDFSSPIQKRNSRHQQQRYSVLEEECYSVTEIQPLLELSCNLVVLKRIATAGVVVSKRNNNIPGSSVCATLTDWVTVLLVLVHSIQTTTLLTFLRGFIYLEICSLLAVPNYPQTQYTVYSIIYF